MGRLVRPAGAIFRHVGKPRRRWQLVHDQSSRSWPGLSDEHCRHLPISAGPLLTDLPALSMRSWWQIDVFTRYRVTQWVLTDCPAEAGEWCSSIFSATHFA